ncbi:MAG: 4Fe-4S single cluster domain-containing protein [Deltaproteobacteria bacterium]
MPDRTKINLHAVLGRSSVNGPGWRVVFFFQGCRRQCRGCFNPDTHAETPRLLCAPDEILAAHLKTDTIEGITVSGGEPFLQPKGLLGLLKEARLMGLSTVVYTGFEHGELMEDETKSRCLDYVDVLVDGPYVEDEKEKGLLARGSTNQTFHFLTGRYGIKDFYMPGKVEILIGGDGSVRGTGFSRVELFKAARP